MESRLAGQTGSDPILRVRGLCKRYRRGGVWTRTRVAALNGVDLEIPRGKMLALAGSSGSGKSTVARCVARLEQPDSGEIWFEGANIAALGSRELLPFRSKVQMIFQDATTAMNPRFTAAEVIEEPLRIQGTSRAERRDKAVQLMKEVALSPDSLDRRITHFSGGQRQRIAIARALGLRPKLLVLDESLSGLDLSTQAQIANLLLDLQATHALSYLLISHDLSLVTRIADTISVMADGRIVESDATAQIMADPQHAETRKLVESARAAGFELGRAAGATL